MDSRVAKRMQALRVLWFGLASTNVLYVALVMNLSSHPKGTDVRTMTGALGALALGITIAAFALPARLLAKGIASMKVEIVDEAGETPGGFRQAAVVTRRIARPTETLLDGLARWQSPFIVGMALAEAISLFGVELAYLAAPATTYLAFVAAGFTIMLLKFPQLETLRLAIERAKGATLKPSSTSTNP